VFGCQLAFDAVKIDTSDLVDANEVAALLGLARRQAVSTYRRRYEDFPAPVVEKGQCVLWLREDVRRWDDRRRRRADGTGDGRPPRL
jgi:predicted DNA-binding transcriptional regulator AlpA